MPSHYDKPLPKRKPKAPPRDIPGDAPTRGPNLDELSPEDRKAFEEFYKRVLADNAAKKKGILVDMQKKKLPPTGNKKKMMGGGMASKRNGNMDYRKGGMVYSTKTKKG